MEVTPCEATPPSTNRRIDDPTGIIWMFVNFVNNVLTQEMAVILVTSKHHKVGYAKDKDTPPVFKRRVGSSNIKPS